MRTVKEAISWCKQPGIQCAMPCDPHTQQAMDILIKYCEKSMQEKEQIIKALEEVKNIMLETEQTQQVVGFNRGIEQAIEIVKAGGKE